MKTTVKALRKYGIQESELGLDGDEDTVEMLDVLNNVGLDDALRCLRAIKGHDKEIRLFAVFCARQVEHLMPALESISALDVAERFAHGKATAAELKAARQRTLEHSLDATIAAQNAEGNGEFSAHLYAKCDAAKAATSTTADSAWAAALAAQEYAISAATKSLKASQEKELLRIFTSK